MTLEPVLGLQLSLHRLDHGPDAGALATLAPDEQERAARFHHERDRRRYLAARCALRERLAWHTGRSAASLRFVTGAQGKPALQDAQTCRFNLSHSEDLALIGIGGEDGDLSEVGVDLEWHRPVEAADALARSHFTPAEQAAWAGFDPGSRDAVFLRLWTRKEACLKALGSGLSVAPTRVDAGPGPALRRLQVAGCEARGWIDVVSLDLGSQAVAAVARLRDGA